MFNSIKNNSALFFIIKAIGLYLLWYLLYELWLEKQGKLDMLAINNLVFLSSNFLNLIGYTVTENLVTETIHRTINIEGALPLWIGNPCDGLELFALFTGFIVAYPGEIIKKIIYIPFGLISIHLLNVLRIVGLALTLYYKPEYLDFNHTYTFTILVYSYVFILWMIWTNKISK